MRDGQAEASHETCSSIDPPLTENSWSTTRGPAPGGSRRRRSRWWWSGRAGPRTGRPSSAGDVIWCVRWVSEHSASGLEDWPAFGWTAWILSQQRIGPTCSWSTADDLALSCWSSDSRGGVPGRRLAALGDHAVDVRVLGLVARPGPAAGRDLAHAAGGRRAGRRRSSRRARRPTAGRSAGSRRRSGRGRSGRCRRPSRPAGPGRPRRWWRRRRRARCAGSGGAVLAPLRLHWVSVADWVELLVGVEPARAGRDSWRARTSVRRRSRWSGRSCSSGPGPSPSGCSGPGCRRRRPSGSRYRRRRCRRRRCGRRASRSG